MFEWPEELHREQLTCQQALQDTAAWTAVTELYPFINTKQYDTQTQMQSSFNAIQLLKTATGNKSSLNVWLQTCILLIGVLCWPFALSLGWASLGVMSCLYIILEHRTFLSSMGKETDYTEHLTSICAINLKALNCSSSQWENSIFLVRLYVVCNVIHAMSHKRGSLGRLAVYLYVIYTVASMKMSSLTLILQWR